RAPPRSPLLPYTTLFRSSPRCRALQPRSRLSRTGRTRASPGGVRAGGQRQRIPARQADAERSAVRAGPSRGSLTPAGAGPRRAARLRHPAVPDGNRGTVRAAAARTGLATDRTGAAAVSRRPQPALYPRDTGREAWRPGTAG